MGQKLSTGPAEEKAEEAQKTIDEVLKAFEDKRDLYLDGMKKERGPNAENKTTEVAGGRTIMEYSEIFYTESIGPNSQITDAVGDFFNAADASINGHNDQAKHNAISGAKSLIMAAIDGIIGNTSIGVREIQTFIVLFLNNSFVRIDYVFYQQNIDVVKYLAAVRSTARLVVAEVAVLPIDMMIPAEISYLISQAFDLQTYSNPDVGFATLGKYQTNMVQINVLTRMLQEFLQTENSSEDDGVDTNAITKRSTALIGLSENVNKVLVNIQTSLPKPEDPEPDPKNFGKTSGDSVTLTLAEEQAMKNRYIDAYLDAKGLNEFFTSKQKMANSIENSEKGNILKLLKNTYVSFEEAYEDCSEENVGFSKAFTLWFKESKADFAMWWYTFQRAADAIKVKKDGKVVVVWWEDAKTWGTVGSFDCSVADTILTNALDKLQGDKPIKEEEEEEDTRTLYCFSDRKVRKAILKAIATPPPTTSPTKL